MWPFKKKRPSEIHRDPSKPIPDERVWGRTYTGPAPWIFGLLLVALIIFGVYMAFAKRLPWASDGFTLNATFENAATLRTTNPVRIAGVNVGKVTNIRLEGETAEVTFNVEDEGQPIHSDATIEIRPRLFLEGNFFLDLSPGSPGAPILESGEDIPITQTATAVQIDEVLSALQQPTRRGLQRLLEGYGEALTYEPTAADDADQDASVQGETAAESLNDSLRIGGPAGRDSAIVNEALLGEDPHDLSALIRAQAAVFGKLASRETDLSSLIVNFNVTAGAFAAESANLEATLAELAPTLEQATPSLRALSEALPPLRALAIVSKPGFEELPATIAAATPWLDQVGRLVTQPELGGLAKLLRGAAPPLARASAASKDLFEQQTLLSRCVSHNLVPAGDVVVDDAFSTGQPNFYEFFYGTVQLAGESQSFDGNGPYVRFQSGGGDQLLSVPNPGGGFQNEALWGNAVVAPEGVQPALPPKPPPIRFDVACHKNAVPQINGPSSAVGAPDLTPTDPVGEAVTP